MSQAGWNKVSTSLTDSDRGQIDIGLYSGETNVAKPEDADQPEEASSISSDLPLLFDHLQKIAMINNLLKNRTQRTSIMSSKSSRKPNDGDGRSYSPGTRSTHCRIEVRQYR